MARGTAGPGDVPKPGPSEIGMTTKPLEQPLTDEEVRLDLPWQVVVWNDPVNLMDYVVWVLRKLFGHSIEEATRLMLAVHNEGRATVSEGPREQAEMDCYRLHQFGLWATIEQ
jgi:ATP-dependent Clp protease adaptor protein ClpS